MRGRVKEARAEATAKKRSIMNWYGNQKGEGFEFHILAAGLALVVLIRGGGAISVDRLLTRAKN